MEVATSAKRVKVHKIKYTTLPSWSLLSFGTSSSQLSISISLSFSGVRENFIGDALVEKVGFKRAAREGVEIGVLLFD
jgi:hypothetical protein